MSSEAPRTSPGSQTALAERPQDATKPELKASDFPPLPGIGIDLITLGKFLAGCGYFEDVRSISQAAVKVLLGQELGVPPVTSLMNVYIVNNRPALSAGLMAAKIKASKRYTYRISKLDEMICDIRFFELGPDGYEEIGASVFTKDDAERAGLLRKGGSWSTFRRNMLFARALSNGARWYCPDLFGGPVYTPEELDEPEHPKPKASEGTPETPVESTSAVDALEKELSATFGKPDTQASPAALATQPPEPSAAPPTPPVAPSVSTPPPVEELPEREKWLQTLFMIGQKLNYTENQVREVCRSVTKAEPEACSNNQLKTVVQHLMDLLEKQEAAKNPPAHGRKDKP